MARRNQGAPHGDPDRRPADLRARSVQLAAAILELSGRAHAGDGQRVADRALDDGRAWEKFQAICEAQGGLWAPPIAGHQHRIIAAQGGPISDIDNRRLAKVAKLAGAPASPAAGVDLHVRLEDIVGAGTPVMTVHAETSGELAYALSYLERHNDLIRIAETGDAP